MEMVTKKYSLLADNELLAFLRQGDKAAFTEIYNRYWQELMEDAFCHLQSMDNSKEVVQNVFLSLFLRRQTLRITASLKSYLHTAVKYKVLNRKRSDAIRKEYLNKTPYNISDLTEDPARILYLKELEQQINYTVASLPKKCRKVYILSREEDFSHKDIANELSISVSTVEKHIVKALRIIRSRLHTY